MISSFVAVISVYSYSGVHSGTYLSTESENVKLWIELTGPTKDRSFHCSLSSTVTYRGTSMPDYDYTYYSDYY